MLAHEVPGQRAPSQRDTNPERINFHATASSIRSSSSDDRVIVSRGAEEGSMPEQREAGPSPTDPRALIPRVGGDLAYLQAHQEVFRLGFPTGGMLRFVLSPARRLLRRLLAPILVRQSAYNRVNAQVVSAHAAALDGLRREVPELIDRLAHQETTALEALRQAVVDELEELGRKQGEALAGLPEAVLARVESRVRDLERTVLRQRAQLGLQERRLTMLLEEARKRLPEPLGPEQLRTFTSEMPRVWDELFMALADEFRGSRDEIRQRLEVYLPLLKDCAPCAQGKLLVDVGCGRGEWLELLREHGVAARGVDLSRSAVERCRARGLDVAESDAIAFLRTVPDGAVAALTAFHVIEHLPFDALLELLDQTVRVLATGGFAIFETPNPENVLTASSNFYLDPTHLRPVPRQLLRFLAEARGLCRLEMRTLNPPDRVLRVAERLEVAERFNAYFYGPQDYALIGWRA